MQTDSHMQKWIAKNINIDCITKNVYFSKNKQQLKNMYWVKQHKCKTCTQVLLLASCLVCLPTSLDTRHYLMYNTQCDNKLNYTGHYSLTQVCALNMEAVTPLFGAVSTTSTAQCWFLESDLTSELLEISWLTNTTAGWSHAHQVQLKTTI